MVLRQDEERNLSDADLHIKKAEENIEKIRSILVRLQASGEDATDAFGLLDTMLQSLETMRFHRKQILKALKMQS